MQYFNEGDRLVELDQQLDFDVVPLLGVWENTDTKTKNVLLAEFEVVDNQLMIRAFGATKPELTDWGATNCYLFSNAVDSNIVTGLCANYDFGFKKTAICGNIKYGILVLQIYNTFKDDSGRANYFTREFYHKISAKK